MKVSELGEFGLIDLLAGMVRSSRDTQLTSWKQLIAGIGDDAAAWHGDASIQLATVDSFIQDVHFSIGIDSWRETGWKSLAVNLSDIAAMGGIPRYALVSLALPGNTEVDDIAALYQGMIDLARQHEVALIGGDTCKAPLIVIGITVLGSTTNQDTAILTRSDARPSDKIAVTGYLGTAAAGLEMLDKRLQLDQEAQVILKKAFLQPHPRIAEGQLLVEQGVNTAIDISDGLISDLDHICQNSQVGARISVDRIPVHPAVRTNFGNKSLEMALSGGEDYELLFTGTTEVIDRVKRASSCPVTVIGEILSGKPEITLVDSQGNPFKPARIGWDHFAG
jgi:thiamine-monophosphate kinase